jgi:hypothetical protein
MHRVSLVTISCIVEILADVNAYEDWVTDTWHSFVETNTFVTTTEAGGCLEIFCHGKDGG